MIDTKTFNEFVPLAEYMARRYAHPDIDRDDNFPCCDEHCGHDYDECEKIEEQNK